MKTLRQELTFSFPCFSLCCQWPSIGLTGWGNGEIDHRYVQPVIPDTVLQCCALRDVTPHPRDHLCTPSLPLKERSFQFYEKSVYCVFLGSYTQRKGVVATEMMCGIFFLILKYLLHKRLCDLCPISVTCEHVVTQTPPSPNEKAFPCD